MISLKSILKNSLKELFPGRCLSCGNGEEEGRILCQPCLGSVAVPPPNLCANCARPLGFTYEIDTGGEYFCGECRLDPPPYDSAIYGLGYEGPVRELVHTFKFGNSPYLAQYLVELGGERLVPWLAGKKGAIMVPVPLHWIRLYNRGYNHAHLLSKKLAKNCGLYMGESFLVRTRYTKMQYGLNAQQRKDNVRAAFSAPHPGAIKGRDIVLFDDIITTGATARECCKALWKAKPNSVSLAALCKAGQ